MTAISKDLYFLFLSLRFEFGNFLKRRRILIAAAFAITTPLLLPFIFTFPDTAKQFASGILSFTSFLIIHLSALMFAGDSISGEFEKKTGLLLFPTPQRRISILAGKYLAVLAAVWLVVLILYIVVTAQIIVFFSAGSIPVELGKSYLLAAFYSFSVVSVIYFCSSLFKKSLTSVFIGLFFLLLALPGFTVYMEYLSVSPWFIITYQHGLTTKILTDGFVDWSGIAVVIVYAIIFFAAGTWIANRKDMT